MGGKKPHALVIPYPAQGHVMPLMEFSHRLIDRGFKITFLNTDFDHAPIVASLSENTFDNVGSIRLVSIPDGLDPEGDRNKVENLFLALSDEFFLTRLEELIEKINKEGEDKISCVIADVSLGAGLVVAQKMGIPKAAFFPAATGLLATLLHIPKLIEEGIIESTNDCLGRRLGPRFLDWADDSMSHTKKLRRQISGQMPSLKSAKESGSTTKK